MSHRPTVQPQPYRTFPRWTPPVCQVHGCTARAIYELNDLDGHRMVVCAEHERMNYRAELEAQAEQTGRKAG